MNTDISEVSIVRSIHTNNHGDDSRLEQQPQDNGLPEQVSLFKSIKLAALPNSRKAPQTVTLTRYALLLQ
jgi:hypothetical protein